MGRSIRLCLVGFVLVATNPRCADSPPDGTAGTPASGEGRTAGGADLPGVATWSLSAEPIRRLGSSPASSGQDLYLVQDVIGFPDGRLAVANAGRHQVLMFGPDDRLVWSTGREGSGPGEFRGMAWMRRYRGDSLAVYDWQLGRVSILSADGSVGRTVRLGSSPSAGGGAALTGPQVGRRQAPTPDGVFDDGSFLASLSMLSAGPGDTTAVRRDSVEYGRFSPEGAFLNPVAVLPDDEQFLWADGGSRSIVPRAFGKRTLIGIGSDRLYVADNVTSRFAARDLRGELVGSFGTDLEPTPLKSSDRERWREERLAQITDDFMRSAREAPIREMPFPGTLPFFDAIRVGPGDEIWLADYAATGGAKNWTIFDRGGTRIARVRAPGNLRIEQIGRDRITGVSTDDLGVEQVVVYRLTRE